MVCFPTTLIYSRLACWTSYTDNRLVFFLGVRVIFLYLSWPLSICKLSVSSAYKWSKLYSPMNKEKFGLSNWLIFWEFCFMVALQLHMHTICHNEHIMTPKYTHIYISYSQGNHCTICWPFLFIFTFTYLNIMFNSAHLRLAIEPPLWKVNILLSYHHPLSSHNRSTTLGKISIYC